MPSTISVDRTCRVTWDQYLASMYELLDDNIYDTERITTVIYALFFAYSKSLQDLFDELEMTRNDSYLWWEVTDEPIIKGESNGLDRTCLFAVVEIISVGDTPGASDYMENVDFQRHQLGIQWTVPQYYGAYWGYGVGFGDYGAWGFGWETDYYENDWYPYGRHEPASGAIFYITYRFGCRDVNLYNNFGRLVKLRKKDTQTYENYRRAIKTLNLVFLNGPTIDNIKDALSVFTDRSNISITEDYFSGWVLGTHVLYSEAAQDDDSIDKDDEIILYSDSINLFTFVVDIANSTGLDQVSITNVLDLAKPAHTRYYLNMN